MGTLSAFSFYKIKAPSRRFRLPPLRPARRADSGRAVASADERLHEALEKRHAMQGKTVSEVAREILSAAVSERPLGTRSGRLRGQLELPHDSADSPRRQLRKRNWRP